MRCCSRRTHWYGYDSPLVLRPAARGSHLGTRRYFGCIRRLCHRWPHGGEGVKELAWLQRIEISLPLVLDLPLRLKLLVTGNDLWGLSHHLKTGDLVGLSPMVEWCILRRCNTSTNLPQGLWAVGATTEQTVGGLLSKGGPLLLIGVLTRRCQRGRKRPALIVMIWAEGEVRGWLMARTMMVLEPMHICVRIRGMTGERVAKTRTTVALKLCVMLSAGGECTRVPPEVDKQRRNRGTSVRQCQQHARVVRRRGGRGPYW